MNRQRKRNSQIEINNLVEGAIANAVARRSQALDLEELSGQQAEAVKGGLVAESVVLTKPIISIPPIICGGFPPVPPDLTM